MANGSENGGSNHAVRETGGRERADVLAGGKGTGLFVVFVF